MPQLNAPSRELPRPPNFIGGTSFPKEMARIHDRPPRSPVAVPTKLACPFLTNRRTFVISAPSLRQAITHVKKKRLHHLKYRNNKLVTAAYHSFHKRSEILPSK